MARQKSQSDGGRTERHIDGTRGSGTEYVVGTTSYRVCDMPARMRPREEMARVGVENVPVDTLLAIILRSGVKGTNVVDLARRLLTKYGSLTGIALTSANELAREKGVGPVRAQVILAALEMGRRLNEERTPEHCRIRSPEDAARLVRDRAKTLEKEVFWALLLDTKNHLKGNAVEVTRGLLDASLVHPREVFREAIRCAAAAVVLVHNHPSGDPAPSAEDIRITKQLVEAGRIVDIKVLDHVVVGRQGGNVVKDFVSMRESGLVEFI
jgi:DNA repair protein RadC